jgi:hypothetical protein
MMIYCITNRPNSNSGIIKKVTPSFPIARQFAAFQLLLHTSLWHTLLFARALVAGGHANIGCLCMLLICLTGCSTSLFVSPLAVLFEIRCRCELALSADPLAEEVEDERHGDEEGGEAAADGHTPVDADAWSCVSTCSSGFRHSDTSCVTYH